MKYNARSTARSSHRPAKKPPKGGLFILKKLILVTGTVATGKSTFARQLSKRIGVPSFHKDSINEIFGSRFSFNTLSDREMLSKVAVELLVHIAERALSVGHSVILEANFKPAEAPAIQALARRQHCELLTFKLGGDLQTIFARYQRRERNPARHKIHKYHRYPDLETFSRSVAPLAAFNAGGQIIDVDTTDFAAIDYDALYNTAKQFILRRT